MTDSRGGQGTEAGFGRPLRTVLVAFTVLACLAVFFVWRIDGPRMERIRAELVDALMPVLDLGLSSGRFVADAFEGLLSLSQLNERAAELELEVERLRIWHEVARQLERENAELRGLVNLQAGPSFSMISAEVLADTSSHFRHSVLINVGSENGIEDGWPAVDGFGVIGRVSGVGKTTSRVVLLTDPNSKVPVKMQTSGNRGLVIGDNTATPPIELIPRTSRINPGERVETSGKGGIFPAGLLMGTVLRGPDERLRVLLAADYNDPDYVSIIRSPPREQVDSAGELIVENSPRGGSGR